MHEKELLQLMNKNAYLLQFIIAQLTCSERQASVAIGEGNHVDEEDQQKEELMDYEVTRVEDYEEEDYADGVREIESESRHLRSGVAEDEDEDLGEVFDGELIEEGDDEGVWKSAWDDEDDDDGNIISLDAPDKDPVEIDLSQGKSRRKGADKSDKHLKKKSKSEYDENQSGKKEIDKKNKKSKK